MGSRVSNNENIGKTEITMHNMSTTVGKIRPIVQADIDAGRNALTIGADNQVGISSSTALLFGQAVATSEDLSAKDKPNLVTINVDGVMMLNGTTTLPTATNSVLCVGGKVVGATGTAVRAIGAKKVPTVLTVWDTDKVNVLL